MIPHSPLILQEMDAPISRWEAVRVRRYYGLQALNFLSRPGSVAVDSDDPSVCFFVLAGTVASWYPMPAGGDLTVISRGFVLPPRTRRTPPGRYWLVPPRQGTIRLCDGQALHTALLECLPHWTGQCHE